jgi:hypothetical protein
MTDNLRWILIHAEMLKFDGLEVNGAGELQSEFERPEGGGTGGAIRLVLIGDCRVALQAALGALNLHFAGEAIKSGEAQKTHEAVQAAPVVANVNLTRAELNALSVAHSVLTARTRAQGFETLTNKLRDALAGLDLFDPPKPTTSGEAFYGALPTGER